MSWMLNISSVVWVINPSINQNVDIKYRQGGTSGIFTSAGTAVFGPSGAIVGASFQITGIDNTWASIEIDTVNECSSADVYTTFTKPA